MIEVAKTNIHWNYYLALESDVESVARYIEFIENNFSTYSIELAHLLLASSSEIDVVLKALCLIVEPGSKPKNIGAYKKIIKEKVPTLINEQVVSPRYGLTLTPWTNWNGKANPDWWKSYNAVKHKRNLHFDEANLHNVLNSIAALLIANMYYCLEKSKAEHPEYPYQFNDITNALKPDPKLFQLKSEYYFRQLGS